MILASMLQNSLPKRLFTVVTLGSSAKRLSVEVSGSMVAAEALLLQRRTGYLYRSENTRDICPSLIFHDGFNNQICVQEKFLAKC